MANRQWTGAASGVWNATGNWEPATIPIAGDDVFIQNNSVSIDAYDNSAVTLGSLTIDASYTGTIGSATATLQTGATLVYIGQHFGQGNPAGSTRLNLDFGSVQTTIAVYSTANTSSDANLEPLRIIGTHASNALTIFSGIVGIATNDETDVATILEATLNGDGAQCQFAEGVTLGTLNVAAGNATVGDDITTAINQSGGTVQTHRAAAVPLWNIDGGTGIANSTGLLTTAAVRGELDFSQNGLTKVVTNLSVHNGATLNLDSGNSLVPTLTNGIDFVRCQPSDINLTLWPNITLTPTAI
jgi:hypothetical protein